MVNDLCLMYLINLQFPRLSTVNDLIINSQETHDSFGSNRWIIDYHCGEYEASEHSMRPAISTCSPQQRVGTVLISGGQTPTLGHQGSQLLQLAVAGRTWDDIEMALTCSEHEFSRSGFISAIELPWISPTHQIFAIFLAKKKRLITFDQQPTFSPSQLGAASPQSPGSNGTFFGFAGAGAGAKEGKVAGR